ncbi:10550_t:CDS:1 [Ambispora leptoticha]|uniref:10550_t:CDS:1 n=1 Tax=Ambispora leptoticha TaxID=144679 RepID=A0A9N9FBW2_9GLOM|nr:10550_t:CDS:1 [Ambispora leptoticha]
MSTVDELNIDDIIELKINNLQSSINHLDWKNSISVEQYMNVDEEIEEKNINNDEIVSIVNHSSLEEEDEIEELIIHSTISVKFVLESLHVLSDFLSNPLAEFAYDRSILLKFGA